MNIVVHKYTIDPEKIDVATGDVVVDMPSDAVVMCVHEQRGQMCVWAHHEPGKAEMEPRRFCVLPTGTTRDVEFARYAGSVFLRDVLFVFHVFEYT